MSTAEEILKIKSKKIKNKNEMFENILGKCRQKIIKVAQYGNNSCFFTIPPVILGMPRYDIMEVFIFIKNKLHHENIRVCHVGGNQLYIDWPSLHPTESQIEAIESKAAKFYNPTKRKPKKSFVLDNNDLLLLNRQKMKNNTSSFNI